jgi:hypothetical protein
VGKGIQGTAAGGGAGSGKAGAAEDKHVPLSGLFVVRGEMVGTCWVGAGASGRAF